ncbi:hypothetical protein C8263_12060 [Deinococcus arcticus]|uniref:Uncharacterized protein n=1 Tax=Deinococcus arcticus TaxID=2136176 RepID=A0A2T3W709_9DEIO|nr:hypothetical protein C8263_12060 [Deinococcus arcticus]
MSAKKHALPPILNAEKWLSDEKIAIAEGALGVLTTVRQHTIIYVQSEMALELSHDVPSVSPG